jgi:lipopolysaccharide export system protein LptA
MQRIEGFGNVHVSTATDIVRADRGVYNADTSIAMMSGNVRITRGQNQLNGDFAEVNLNTGISRLLTSSDSGGDKRVRGLFVPQKADASNTPPAPRRETR